MLPRLQVGRRRLIDVLKLSHVLPKHCSYVYVIVIAQDDSHIVRSQPTPNIAQCHNESQQVSAGN